MAIFSTNLFGMKPVSLHIRSNKHQPRLSSQDTVHFSGSANTYRKPAAEWPEVNMYGNELSDGVIRDDIHKMNVLQKYATPFNDARNFSNRHFACRLEATVNDNGQKITATATNVAFAQGIFSCDLMNGVVKLFEKSKGKEFTVDKMYFVNADVHGGMPTPCGDCQNWMVKSGYFKPDTIIERYYDGAKNKANPKYVLDVQRLGQVLPVSLDAEKRLNTPKELERMELSDASMVKSEAAQKAQDESKIQDEDILKLMYQAQAAWDINSMPEYKDSGMIARDGRPEGVAILFEGPEKHVQSSGKFDFSNLRGISADELAMAQGSLHLTFERLHESDQPLTFEHLKGFQKPKARMIAYYGCLPTVKSLGSISRYYFDHDNTLIVTIERGKMQIRTLPDIIKILYQTDTTFKI